VLAGPVTGHDPSSKTQIETGSIHQKSEIRHRTQQETLGVKLPGALKQATGIWPAKPAAVTSSREKSTTANQNLKTADED
jgi:hypothetical protein